MRESLLQDDPGRGHEFERTVPIEAVAAMTTPSHRFLPQSTAIVLAGHDTETKLVASILSGRGYRERKPHGPQTRRRIVHVESLDGAIAAVRELRCNEIVVGCGLDGRAAAPVTAVRDALGREVRIVSAREMLERLLGRIQGGASQEGSQRSARAAATHVKRALDILISAILIMVLALPAVAVTLLLSVCGVREPIRSSTYVGQDGVRFHLRTFAVTTDRTVAPLSLRRQLSVRIYRLLLVSRFAQAPALISIFLGDMSFVGPRPDTVEDQARLAAEIPLYGNRLACQPGLIGLALVRFRYSAAPRDIRLALEYDLFYIKYRSLAIDARVMGRALLLLVRDWLDGARSTGQYVAGKLTSTTSPLRGGYSARAARFASVAMPEPAGPSAIAPQPTLLVGAGRAGRLLARELRANAEWGLWPVAFVDDDPAKIGRRIEDLPVLGNTGVIPAIVHREQIETVVISMPSASDEVRGKIAEGIVATRANLMSMPNIGDILSGRPLTALRHMSVDDFLGRPVVSADTNVAADYLAGKRVLVTGAAGSIGQEVARQAALLGPAVVYGLDINESDLFDLQQELRMTPGAIQFVPVVGSVTNSRRLAEVFAMTRPDVVFHAAAYKHVPMMESHPAEAVVTNVIGTYETALAAARAGVQRFVLVSTDKAVRPSSVMGATKRLAELVIRDVARTTGLSTCAVRFGNVLGSRGSVIPLFRKQIASGGPVTITHPGMKRFFMTIPEAAGLIIQAGAFRDDGVIYMLDMGEEVAIKDLAERLIRSQGLQVGRDIEIVYSGLRPGEKLREELSLDFETARPTSHPKVRILEDTSAAPRQSFRADATVAHLQDIANTGSTEQIRAEVMAKVRDADGAVGAAPVHQPGRVPYPVLARPDLEPARVASRSA